MGGREGALIAVAPPANAPAHDGQHYPPLWSPCVGACGLRVMRRCGAHPLSVAQSVCVRIAIAGRCGDRPVGVPLKIASSRC